MKLINFCINRPITAIVINVILVVVGLICFKLLQVRELPQIESPILMINTAYTGAAPPIIESQITKPIEDALTAVAGIERIESTSSLGSSAIKIKFDDGADMNAATNDVRDVLSVVRKQLPQAADTPVLYKSTGKGGNTSMLLSFSLATETQKIYDYVNLYIKPNLQQISGVGSVNIFGGEDPNVYIWLNMHKMADRKITASDVINTIQNQNAQIPTGQIVGIERKYTVTASSDLNEINKFYDLIVRDVNGYLVRLADFASITKGDPDSLTQPVKLNGTPAVILAISPQTTANPVEMAQAVLKQLKLLSPAMPKGMTYSIIYNQADYIKSSIDEVYKTILEAIFFVALVILLFLGSLRAALIPIITIPICLIATFAIMLAFKFSINTMSMLALVLAIGLVVDDAIVMIENIFRYLEKKFNPILAAKKAGGEIGVAIIIMTITLATVYAPIAFMQGITGKIFREFAYTLAGSVLISGFVALTLTPMMGAYILKPIKEQNQYFIYLENFFDFIKNKYTALLELALSFKYWILGGLLIIGCLGIALFMSLPKQLIPMEDKGFIFVGARAPDNATVNYLNQQMTAVKDLIQKTVPKGVIKNFVEISGFQSSTQGTFFLPLVAWDQRKLSQTEISGLLNAALFQIPGVWAGAAGFSNIPGASNDNGVALEVLTTDTYPNLAKIMDKLVSAAKDNPNFTAVNSNLNFNNLVINVDINRNMAALLHVNVNDIANALSIFLAGRHVSDLLIHGYSYKVMVQAKEKSLRDPQQLNNIYVRSQDGKLLPLSTFISLKKDIAPAQLNHYDRLRSASLDITLKNGYTVAQAIDYLNNLTAKILPDNMQTSWTGAAKHYLEAQYSMLIIFGLALLFIYLFLSALFESFIDPLIIMLTVPFSIIGAVVFLKIIGGSNNIYSQIGMITLIGLITKHGILITEFANKKLEQGLSIKQAILEASGIRLRPVLMTTGAMVLGALPLALATGAGHESRVQMGVVTIGGMLIGTIFSLVIVPLVYSILKRKQRTIVE